MAGALYVSAGKPVTIECTTCGTRHLVDAHTAGLTMQAERDAIRAAAVAAGWHPVHRRGRVSWLCPAHKPDETPSKSGGLTTSGFDMRGSRPEGKA